ncbi:hypothetical protein Tco_1066567 [Tanacetum coccineum]|uniref:Reverse transcriptase Ty1/copia-type domain-containing protein n=1 Tax=Tanacetum coccineum TaxID=301880 RepID=A0ABQ5HAY0_9ASTR
MLKKFGLEDSKPMKTPMSSDTKLTKDQECESVDSTKYRGMIGSLLYLTASRPDILFNVCLCARFQEDPKISHLEAVKRIFRYIKGTTHLGLWYPKGTGIETVVCVDSDHAGDYVDRKSTSEDDTIITSPITKSSSLSPPNAPSKTPSTKDISSTFGTTSSLFESKPQSSPPSSNDTPSPQPSNPFLDDIKDVPPRPSNPIPLQSHPSLDITLSLSPITPLDHILDTPSPPSPQLPPQPPLMGHPIYLNTFDYYGVNYLCCFHNRNLIFSLRDEMNLMFAHLEYLLTSAIALPSPPHP